MKFDTSKGAFVVQVTRAWAPQGADRFYNLVKSGFYDNVRFFRVISGFMVQFGISGDPAVMAGWRNAPINDDKVVQSNKRGFITFAMAGPNTRTSQVFINFADNARLDGSGFAPFGQVVSGMEVVDKLNPEYGEGAPRGSGPDQGRLQSGRQCLSGQELPANGFRQESHHRTLTGIRALAHDRISKKRKENIMAKPEDTLTLETTQGPVVIAMRPDLAPGHVARIKELVKKGFYDGIVFHRVIDGFMAQTGCPQGTGTGGSGQEAQGRVQQGAACARHGVDGARGQSRIPATASSSSASTTPASSTTSTPPGAT